MKIHCPQCGVSGTLDDAFLGRKIKCPKCRTLFMAGQEQVPVESEKVNIPDDIARDDSSDSAEPASDIAAVVTKADMADGTPDAPVDQMESGLDSGPPPLPTEELVTVAEAAASSETGTQEMRQESGYQPQRFTVGESLSRAWDLTGGVKGPIWGGLLITYGVLFALVAVMAALAFSYGGNTDDVVGMLGECTSSALSAIFTAGLMYMGVRRATGRKVIWKDVFSGFEVWGKILIAAFLQVLLVTIGFVLLILPGVYLLVGYLLTFPLIIDKQMSPWQAMETSRKAIHKVWWKICGLYILTGLICSISAIPFGIGLIWTLPMAVILGGVVYDYLFNTKKKAD